MCWPVFLAMHLFRNNKQRFSCWPASREMTPMQFCWNGSRNSCRVTFRRQCNSIFSKRPRRGGQKNCRRWCKPLIDSDGPDDNLKDYRESEFGGVAARGREIFFGRADVSCRRCHKVDGSGGDVGPDLSRIGLDKRRDYLLESIVDPNKQIAKGFETAILQLANGKVYAGIIKSEDNQHLRLHFSSQTVNSSFDRQIRDRRTISR